MITFSDPQPGTLDAKAQGCQCGWHDMGDAENGPRVVPSIHAACPIHGEKDPLGLGRICSICGTVPVGSKNPETTFCRMCYYTGQKDAADLNAEGRGLLDRLRQVEGVHMADVWHTGGGCMVLAVEMVSGELITSCHPDGPEMVGPEGPWAPIRSETVDAWHEWEEERLVLPTPEQSAMTDDDLVAYHVERGAVAVVEFAEHGCAHPDDDIVLLNDGKKCTRCGAAIDGDYKAIAEAWAEGNVADDDDEEGSA